MDKVQFILQYTGQVTLNQEYTVELKPGQALLIDWFANNDIIVETKGKTMRYNATNTRQIDEHRYLIQIIKTENLHNVPVQFERGDYLVAQNIVINQREKTYFTADQIDILPDELVAAHGDRVTRVLFSGNKAATEHYVKK